MYIGLLLLINVLAAFMVAQTAKEKGRSPVLFWFITFFTSFITGMILAAVLPSKKTEEQTTETDISNFKNNFVGKYLIFIILTLILGFATRVFGVLQAERGYDFLAGMDSRLLYVFAVIALTGFSAVLTMRARGLDLSIVPMMGWGICLFITFGTQTGSVWIGMGIALIGCALSGLLLGLFVALLKLPAYIPTLLWGLVVGASTTMLFDYSLMKLDKCLIDTAANTIWFGLVLVLAAFLIAFFTIFFSKLKKPIYQRADNEKKGFVYIMAYSLSGMFAAAAGIVITLIMKTGNVSAGQSYLVYIVAIFAIILSTKISEKRGAPALIVLGSAAVLAMSNVAIAYQRVIRFENAGYYASSIILMVIILLIFVRITHKKPDWTIENY